ncbi:Metallophosphoesterase [Sphingomonas sp. EC-HK361]|uniref:metallophosphoesterase family protein n=1 Tax=Sphingomonas sp. EC-HK361 TaxID=2038397 RepID=UPI001258D040|nr:metallophosphoesterase [Sphingomonas sp. EC-HK361]VVT22467.1 Metallophosphoesterase [Sphingomonas sp. EC-HK361]
MRIAVITDIHAMHGALATALSDARAEGFDVLLILGDLLTYGVDPAETLDLVQDAVARDGAILVAGNHDQIYRDLDGGADGYLAALPDWLRETVEWTAAAVPAHALARFDWAESWHHCALFAAHANPGSFGDWTYLTETTADAAASTLRARGYRYGIFGHTHRARRFDAHGVSLFTLGSLGQPRDDADRGLKWTMIDMDETGIRVSSRRVAFDRDAHCSAIRATTLSAATQDRLCGFFA